MACVFSSRRRAIAALRDSETGWRFVRAAKFLAQVYDANVGERTIGDARFQLEQLVLAVARVVVALEGRSGGAEHHDGVFEMRAVDGCVATVIPRRFFLLVAGLVLLIHDDQAEVFERRENRGARADHYARFPAADAPPFARALHIRQAAVQSGDGVAELCADQAGRPTA